MKLNARSFLYKCLGADTYLSLIRKSFFFYYKKGLLRKNPAYKWHYFAPHLLKKGDVVIDIGANLGYFSYVFAKAIGPEGKLFSVEPVRTIRQQLLRQMAEFEHVEILPFALGDENKEEIILGIPKSFRDIGYLRHGLPTLLDAPEHQEPDEKFSFASELRKASEVFSGLAEIQYIKCDIEGYETVVFEDMKALLAKHQPMVQLETWGDQLPVMLNFFANLGFEAFMLFDGKLRPLSAVPKAELGTSDILFVPKKMKGRIQPFLS